MTSKGIDQLTRMIGNATPPPLANALAMIALAALRRFRL